MKSFRLFLLLAMAALLTSCTITQTANPAVLQRAPGEPICVIEKLDVREDFRTALLTSLRTEGFDPRILPEGSGVEECPLSLSYNARYSWDFVLYMAWAELKAYKAGELVGDALYSAPRGGWAMTVRIYETTHSKVDTMVSQLFPN